MRYQAIASVLILAVFSAGAVLASDIYRWVDDEGNIHFGDRPDGEQAERLEIESRPTDPARVQAMNEALTVERYKAQEAKSVAAAEQSTAAELRAEADERAMKCTTYKAQLEAYTNNRRLFRESADGERAYLTDAEIDATREGAAKKVAEFCS